MAMPIQTLVKELKFDTRLQQTLIPVEEDEYVDIIKRAIRRLYVDTARAAQYSEDMYYIDEDTGELMFSVTLPADEYEYVLICAQIAFYDMTKAGVNFQVGYTTDAISVTNADKPFANMKDTLSKLENERRITYFKMIRYVINDS